MSGDAERRHRPLSMYGRCEYIGCNEQAVTSVRLASSSGDQVARPKEVADRKSVVELCRRQETSSHRPTSSTSTDARLNFHERLDAPRVKVEVAA